MIRILDILPGNRAVVSTADLFRVVIEPGAEIMAELFDEQEASECVDLFNAMNRGRQARAVDYAALAQSSSS